MKDKNGKDFQEGDLVTVTLLVTSVLEESGTVILKENYDSLFPLQIAGELVTLATTTDKKK